MFTIRKVFSRTLTISAVVASVTGTIVSTIVDSASVAISVEAQSTPPTTFGVVRSVK